MHCIVFLAENLVDLNVPAFIQEGFIPWKLLPIFACLSYIIYIQIICSYISMQWPNHITCRLQKDHKKALMGRNCRGRKRFCVVYPHPMAHHSKILNNFISISAMHMQWVIINQICIRMENYYFLLRAAWRTKPSVSLVQPANMAFVQMAGIINDICTV